MTRNVLDSAAADLETLKTRRIATLDLESASLDADRDKFEAFLTDRVAEAVVSSRPDRYRALWRSLLIEADRRFAWQPPPLPARPISLEPSNDATARRATRVLAMVHELHKAGYQRIRILPYLSASGWWRCEITSADNIAGDGYTIEPSGDTDDAVARYSRAEGGRAEDLLYLFADWDLGPEVLGDWQPPPPIRS